MHRKYFNMMFLLALLIASVSTANAAPNYDIEIHIQPFWQNDPKGYGLYGCTADDTACQKAALEAKPYPRTMDRLGCAITSMAMLYYGWGMCWMPIQGDPLLWDKPDITKKLNPGRLNQWAATKDAHGKPLGYNIDGTSVTLNFVKTSLNFMYTEPYTMRFWERVVLKDDCDPFVLEVEQKNGKVKTYRKHADCSVADMSDPDAYTWR